MTSADISGNYGPVHGGSGHQFNGTTFFLEGGQRLLRSGRDPRRMAKEHLARLNRQFVEPPGYAMAQAVLESYGCVILVGASGIGRRAAGQVLLRRLGGEDALVQDESGIPQAPGDPILDSEQVTKGDLILLDPSDVQDADLFDRLMRQLPAYQAELRNRGASLVVVLAESHSDLVRAEVRQLLVTLRRPDAALVVRRHLEVAEIPFAEHQVRDSKALHDRQRTDPMRTLAELVRLIGDALDQLGPGVGFPGWLEAALGVLDELGHKVAAQVKDLRGGAQRALLLATAMLTDAPADQVDFAAAALTRAVAQPDDERPPLERDDLTQRLAELDIAVGGQGRLRFSTFGYERAVRRHFWDNFAALRDNFRIWARELAVSPNIDAHQRDQFVSRFADQALRTGRPDDIVTLVSAWLRPTAVRQRSLPAAALALERGLGDQRQGARFRRLIYDWSRDRNVDKNTAYLAITLCAEVIASTHPSEAVVRLHHFVRRQADDVRDAATEALLRLVRQDRREFRRLLDRVVIGLTEAGWDADFTLFLTLARPLELVSPGSIRLLGESFVRERLLAGWQAAMFGRPTADWADLAREWLDAVEDFPLDGLWLDTLAGATVRPGVGAGRLYGVVRDWARQPGADRRSRNAVALELTHRMEQAQGAASRADSRHPSEEPVR
jgi:hypothetical protein